MTSFYHITSTKSAGETAWTIGIALNPDHGIYQGHFPGSPVLPGVCALQIIKECIAGLSRHTYRYAQVNSCKFLSAINPIHTPELELSLSTKSLENGQIQLIAGGRAGETDFIKLKAILTRQ